MIRWKDVTSYSQSDKERIPRIWEYIITDNKSVKIRITVHKHIYTGNDWNLSCSELGIDMKRLQSKNIDEAKNEAVIIVYQALRKKAIYYQRASHCIEWDSEGECK